MKKKVATNCVNSPNKSVFTTCTNEHCVPKLAAPSFKHATKYRTLHYLNITYGHTHYDVHTLPCVLSVTSL